LAYCAYRYGLSHPLGLQNTEERFNGEIFRQLIESMNSDLFNGRGKIIDGLSANWVKQTAPINLNEIFVDDFRKVVEIGVNACEALDQSHSFPSIIEGNVDVSSMGISKVKTLWNEMRDVFQLDEH
jgi:hypothetical protein